jgi:phosphate transport system substrate-binding protein
MSRRTALIAVAFVAGACGGGKGNQTAAATAGGAQPAASTASTTGLTGAGSTFAYPLYQRWFYEYAQNTGVHVNYQAIGSGGGIRQLMDQTVDFGATDGPMTDQQLAEAKGGPILHLPSSLGAVAISYNVPGVPDSLKLTGPVIADIYLGKITRWNDPAIAALNPGVKLPAQDILVTHRSEGSGTTYIFTDFLSGQSPAWKSGPGKATDIQWPVGLGGKGTAGVAALVQQNPGSIGYIELAYALQNHLPVALVKNPAGRFLPPSLEGATAAAAAVASSLPATTDFRISIVNAPAPDAYPISSFTWLLVYQNQTDATKGKELVNLIDWGLHQGQALGKPLDYAPLPPNMVQMETERLKTIKLPPAA